ncbi:MAG: nucleotidyltransferase domain-containing protein [Candidatus Parabeggiatoa sp. nov. 2]|nr:MAG: nucleotidyltransferase domain-containing protein [Gammaproteobacteria bacterium]
MRLSNRIHNIIKKNSISSFGDVNIYLFGSRTDDAKKGGDIDIAIDTNISKEEFKALKIKFITSLVKLGFDLKIDVVQYKNSDKLLADEIKNTMIKL